jgi:hypothetical protein
MAAGSGRSGNVKENEMVCMNTNVSRSVPVARMSPTQFAQDECANRLADGGCLGVGVDSLVDRGQVKTCTPRARCRVAEGRRCDYFERVVLPLADRPSPNNDPAAQARRLSAKASYQGFHGIGGDESGTCSDCGGPRPKGHRFCESCGGRRRRAATRRRVQRYREMAVSV